LKRCSDRCGDNRGRGSVMEQCVVYDAASAGGEVGPVSNTKRTASGSRRGDDGIPVKLLSINTSVGTWAREQAAGRVHSGPVATTCEIKSTSTTCFDLPCLITSNRNTLTYDIEIHSPSSSNSFVIPAYPTVLLLRSTHTADRHSPREPLTTAPRCCRGPEACLLPSFSASARLES
jgi:hypothetical protein